MLGYFPVWCRNETFTQIKVQISIFSKKYENFIFAISFHNDFGPLSSGVLGLHLGILFLNVCRFIFLTKNL